MTAYIIRRLILVIPTLFGIMLINFAIIQIVPGGPVEQMIAQMTGTAVESTARFSGGGEEITESFNLENFSNNESKFNNSFVIGKLNQPLTHCESRRKATSTSIIQC